ncbi:hypothetical protein BTHE68_18920 [Burkholderia sp. THE68]|uniref:hypothetical protein n=1 Tax=Burkholderia sp. THE68 TaxID=758782 RepID=UPI001318CC05|nr:hypothetical protein [Burkholderia sp. THE68]BBU28158.1 hypothetical protein BTHE68_18920 [Burkholderia sp. THE68]
MTEPLIVVEGNLRLPTLRALTDPLLNFGFEWSPIRSRPAQSQFEYALFAARLDTAYVPALALSDRRSPYRPASLWAVFARDHLPPAMLSLLAVPQTTTHADDFRAEPIHLEVGAPAAARRHGFSKPVATAIAAACGVLIVWLLFGLGPGSTRNTRPASAENIGTRAHPDAVAPAPAPTTLPAAASTPSALAKVEATPDLPAPPAATIASTKLRASKATDSGAIRLESVLGATAPKKSARRPVAVAAVGDRKPEGHIRTVHVPRAKPAPAHAHTAVERIERFEHVARHEVMPHARATSVQAQTRRTSKAATSMDPTALYQMLQHSPTLDSNAGPSGHAAENGAR